MLYNAVNRRFVNKLKRKKLTKDHFQSELIQMQLPNFVLTCLIEIVTNCPHDCLNHEINNTTVSPASSEERTNVVFLLSSIITRNCLFGLLWNLLGILETLYIYIPPLTNRKDLKNVEFFAV